jgi:uncharacterized protein Yka (UPF0111/DUF47 family)
MARPRWFLPEAPDVVGLLREQLAAALTGLEALCAWADGEEDAAAAVAASGHAAQATSRRLVDTLRHAFVLPMDPEDAFELSRGIDAVLRGALDLVREADVIGCAPDAAILAMATDLRRALAQLDEAIACLGRGEDPTAAVDAAIATERGVERHYRDAMAAMLADGEDLHGVLTHRELYRRCARMGEALVETAERAIHADVKER